MYHFLSAPSVTCKGQPSMSSDPWLILSTANWTSPYQPNQILPWGFKMEWIKMQIQDEVSHNVGYRNKSDEILTLVMPISKQKIPEEINDERPGSSRKRWERDEKEMEAVAFFGS